MWQKYIPIVSYIDPLKKLLIPIITYVCIASHVKSLVIFPPQTFIYYRQLAMLKQGNIAHI